jgi:tRNA threonylcarbamoyladenosine biosynthesis protein TsaE
MAIQIHNQINTIRTSSEEETIAAGKRLAAHLSGIVLLSGQLGAGKTTLVRGIVAGIAGTQADEVSSPTFTLIHDYGAGVFHLDLYRLEGEREFRTLGLDDIFDNARLVLIEWGEKLGARTPALHTGISIERAGDDGRVIQITKRGGADVAGTRTT